ncbi:LOW QUALITY PROTEIN: protocadherin-like wing polarity protein stan [Atheta coriaria]|uniref:LOW QUALITY PROTEIN: protocadherin-like wing polarity protein stan n=1 Tax=Dalotia coriaria TaxID=877792 RepID=UPI0031F407AA
MTAHAPFRPMRTQTHRSRRSLLGLTGAVLVLLASLQSCACYLLLVTEDQLPGDLIFDASVYKLGSERDYKINLERSASFVSRLLRVDPHNGRVSLKQRLECNSLYYPNLFTVHIDSTSNRLRDIDYYSLPLRIFIVGKECSKDAEEEEDLEAEFGLEGGSRSRRSITYNPFLHRAHPNVRTRITDAKQWISETYASFAIPTADKWRKICLRQSQFVNSVSAFLPRTIAKSCEVDFIDVSDRRFKIEQSQGDLVAAEDVCIREPLWKVVIFFTTRCKDSRVLDSDHRLKIVYHHQVFNDTDIAKRVRRELRNQSPFFEQHLYVVSVLEECEPGVVVTTLKARDPENSPVTYSMTSLLDSRTQSMFDIDSKTGIVTTKVQLDRELVDVHYFRVTATDDSFPPRSGTSMLQINVLDANDHTPAFEMNEYDATVREGVSFGSTVLTLKATDQDIGKNAEVEYAVQSVNGGGISTAEEDNNAFKIDAKTGVITTRTNLDRETTEVYTLIVTATDQATPASARRSASASVVIRVLDDNDNYPQFSERAYTATVNEDINWNENPVVAHIKATDADQGNNAAIRFAIIGGNTQSQFTIDSLTGDVTLVKPLDYETIRSYRLVIRAQDGGSPARSNTTQLLINVKDVNDNAPRFYTSLFQESVSESVSTGYSIVKVQAYDADEGPNADIKYTIASQDAQGMSTEDIPLSVDSHTGWIYTTKELDREEHPKYSFQVIASDQGNPPQSASASIIITVQDVNDNNPIFDPKVYDCVVAEDDSPGTPVTSVTATDIDEDTRIHYEISSGNTRGRFSITSQNGRGLITVAQPLDYKQEKRYVLTVTASDSGGRTDTATVYVNVSDANNFAPVFDSAPYSVSVNEDVQIGYTVLLVTASDNDVGINAKITYTLGEDSVEVQPFTINPQTGAIITTKLLDRESVSGYLLTVTARDGGHPPLSDTTDVEITVTDINDNYPIFKQLQYSGSVLEDALLGTSVVQVSATDADIGLNGRIRYILSEKDMEDGSFVIDPTSGVIRTHKGLDRESVAVYNLEASAIDRGSPALSTTVPVVIRIEDVNDSPPTFESDKITLYISENSPIGSTVGEIYAKDPDDGVNAIVQYSIIGGEDSESFSLITRPGSEKAELITMTELDYESSRKKFDLIVRAASPPLRNDVHVEVVIIDVNDNAPVLKDFHVLFNNYKDCFPTGPIGKIPAYDADVSDKLHFRILSGNNANLVALNESTGQLQLSPQLNTNVPKIATMEVSVTDGINDIKAIMQLTVKLITEEMLFSSITVRLNDMTKEAFLSPLLSFFVDGLAAIIPCPKENIFIFSIQDDIDVQNKILNVSFSVKRPDVPREDYYSQQFLKERVYLNRAILARLSTVQILPFDDNLCVSEPCLNYEECLTVLKFGNASGFISSNTVLFRPIYPVTTFTCQCPEGFTGSREHYLCDTEVNLCYSAPCQNNGTCRIKEGGYTCVCQPGYSGNNCEIKLNTDPCKPNVCRSGATCTPRHKGGFVCEDCSPITGQEHYTPLCELKSRSFSKNSFLTFPSLKQRHRLHLQMKFATLSPNGLLLYNGRYNELHDFIALEIINGGVQFSFSLGSEVSHVEANIPGGVADGKWHTVTVAYFNKKVTLSLDECDTALALKFGDELGGQWACAGFVEHTLERKVLSDKNAMRVESVCWLLRARRWFMMVVQRLQRMRFGGLTSFGIEAIEVCESHGSSDLFNCTSDRFVELRNQLSMIEKGELNLNTFVAIQLASDLHKATNVTPTLYGADVLITYDLIQELLKHENRMHGLNLTHSQDKDYINNIVHSASAILDQKYDSHWKRITDVSDGSAELLVSSLAMYINILSDSQHDTYTSPFELVSPNLAIGLDVVTPESLFGYEQEIILPSDSSFTTEKVILPDTSQFLDVTNQNTPSGPGPLVAFPKYNNYLQDRSKFDMLSKILVPLKLLGIKPIESGELITKHSLPENGAVISYAQYKQAGELFPALYDDSVLRRWGVDITIGSPLMSVSILVPEYVNAVSPSTKNQPKVFFEEGLLPSGMNFKEFDKKSFADDKHENDAYLRSERFKRSNQKLLYKSLSNVVLDLPIRLQIWLDQEKMIFNERSNPQCVHWSTARGFGEWSRVGCHTELDSDWFDLDSDDPLLVNCTCNHLSTFAVLVDVVDLEYIPEPSLMENISTYSCFSIALPLLFATYLCLAFLRGAQTNSNTIRKNLVLCVFLAELLYFIALKARRPMVSNEIACKLFAMSLHYLWLGGFAWMLVDAIHLYRMLTEMRDINHGPMRFYYCIGYVLPAVIVSLAVGVRAHQYGNYYFCWVSLYESVIWSVVGPISILVFFNLCVLLFAVRAAFTLQDHVMGFGNLRSLLWVSVVALPLLGGAWVLALLAASEKHPLLTPFLSVAVLIHAIFSLLGYCIANNRVRQHLVHMILRCMGKKVPLLENNSVAGVGSTSSQNINAQSRSALAYHSSAIEAVRRNVGISTSSTTSRSTTKTSSSPYRSDTHLRHTSTSTSNYNSTSDVPSYLRGFDHESALHRHREIPEEDRRERRHTREHSGHGHGHGHGGGESDSDSDGSEGRSLDLASSHSSDDDESSTRRHRTKSNGQSRQGYLPNITEHVVTRCGTPPALNVVTKSQLFPAVQPYGPRWSSQLPESYLHGSVPEVGRWSAETGSDNEFCHKTGSPNPLPNPEMPGETYVPPTQSEQYMMRAHYDQQYVTNMGHMGNLGNLGTLSNLGKSNYKLGAPHDNMNYHEYPDRCSDVEEKHHVDDKYLFPYTAEEDHLTTNNYMHPPSSRMMSPIGGHTNDINNPGMDYHGPRMGSRMGSVLGSVHGSLCGSARGSPSPMMPHMPTMMHSTHHSTPDPSQKEIDEETSV